jgi:hypothetical protein
MTQAGVSLWDRAVGCAETPATPGFHPAGFHPFCNPICEVKGPTPMPGHTIGAGMLGRPREVAV